MEHNDDVTIAHVRRSDGAIQPLCDHLCGTAQLAKDHAAKIGFDDEGYLLGLIHDLGKYSTEFQNYIKSATGRLDPDGDAYLEDPKNQKGKVDHSTAGAQWVWQQFASKGPGSGELCAQILALCIASHHSGLIDVLHEDGSPTFESRIHKAKEKTHLEECLTSADQEITAKMDSFTGSDFLRRMVKKIIVGLPNAEKGLEYSKVEAFRLGLLTRFLFSCLIDADRLNSAEFEDPLRKSLREKHRKDFSWDILIDKYENYLSQFQTDSPINAIRRDISNACLERASDEQGTYTLTVPTGGGKTLASLRYALHHAQKHELDHIYYIIPYTSIIEQNTAVIREIFFEHSEWILEHHSGIEPENQNWHSKLAAENWDAPLVCTTMVQFLESLFAGGTSKPRRMHQLARSVLIFDEIQTLPLACTHIFCHALNFLVEHGSSTAILCTATQPLLDQLRSPENGQLNMAENSEIISNQYNLFKDLERVVICDKQKAGGWDVTEISQLAVSQLSKTGSCLVIVNTKKWAQDLFISCRELLEEGSLFHLSTHQYPKHRSKILDEIKMRLRTGKPVLCISTQLIEAGVDIDFASVIRFAAGLDSIAQAAGRCNRNAKRQTGEVYILNPKAEHIEMLQDIAIGRDKFLRICNEFTEREFLYPDAIAQYFRYYFFDRSKEMTYPFQSIRDDSLLNILSQNSLNIGNQTKSRLGKRLPIMQHSFKLAGQIFQAIDTPSKTLIIQHGEGEKIVGDLCALAREFNPAEYDRTLKKAQRFSVNVFPNIWKKLMDAGAIHEIGDEGIYFLGKEFYSDEFGLSTEAVADGGACI